MRIHTRTMVVLCLAGVAASAEPLTSAGPICIPAPGSPKTITRSFAIPLGDGPEFPFCEHIDQRALPLTSEQDVFDAGDSLFDRTYTSGDGIGANLSGDANVTLRFSRVPRADMPGFANRATGPNASSCAECHMQPVTDGAGPAGLNVFRDPQHSGDKNRFIQRNTPHIFGQAGLQLLAEEMTDELQAEREAARMLAVRNRSPVDVQLTAKGLPFGSLRAFPGGRVIEVSSSYVDKDLVVRPFQWKGNMTFVREFTRDACHNEIGMQGEELAGTGVDGDGDGVVNELTVGDMTAMTVYVAGQPPPSRRTFLSMLGYMPPVADRVAAAISRGKAKFEQVGCTACHVNELRVTRHEWTEPSQHPAYRDATFPSGADPVAMGLDPAHPVRIDLTRDTSLPYPVDPMTGQVILELYSDLRRHDLGPENAETIDETGSGPAVFLTRPLWGLGDSAPYMHDGKATNITDAVRFHGGEAAASRAKFQALDADGQADIVEFLKDLVMFKPAGG